MHRKKELVLCHVRLHYTDKCIDELVGNTYGDAATRTFMLSHSDAQAIGERHLIVIVLYLGVQYVYK